MQNFKQAKKTCKTPLGETGCLGKSYFAGYLCIQFFNSHTHVTDLGDAMPRQRSLYTYLRERRISLGVIRILSMNLRLHT